MIRVIQLALAILLATPAQAQDKLPSWNDGAARQAVIEFVEAVTSEGGVDFVPPAERIAVFDNDGTLWVEQPYYTQLAFVVDRVKALTPAHPEWQTREPFGSVLVGDLAKAAGQGQAALLELVMATHAGQTTADFADEVSSWMDEARHPRFNRPYTELVYQPMLELLDYLREHGFKTFIVSGGGIDFMRPWTEAVYAIPPEQVVGSSIKTKFEMQAGRPVLLKLPELDFIDDGRGKPVGIYGHIGRQPIFAAGNSDGDLEMLQYTTGGPGRRFGMIVHHDDAVREYAYDRQSHVGRLDRALDLAPDAGWPVVSMKDDWATIFPGDDR